MGIMKAIGIDPGLSNTGYGIVEYSNQRFSIIAEGVITASRLLSLPEKLLYIYDNLKSIIEEHSPSYAAIEETYVNINPASSLKLAHARAVAILALKQNCLDVAEYQAKTVKKTICGNGNADKVQVASMLRYLMPISNISREKHDNTDAVAIAICHIMHIMQHKRAM